MKYSLNFPLSLELTFVPFLHLFLKNYPPSFIPSGHANIRFAADFPQRSLSLVSCVDQQSSESVSPIKEELFDCENNHILWFFKTLL